MKRSRVHGRHAALDVNLPTAIALYESAGWSRAGQSEIIQLGRTARCVHTGSSIHSWVYIAPLKQPLATRRSARFGRLQARIRERASVLGQAGPVEDLDQCGAPTMLFTKASDTVFELCGEAS